MGLSVIDKNSFYPRVYFWVVTSIPKTTVFLAQSFDLDLGLM